MHCRDLKYVNSLFRAYATEEKILETLALAEQHGINTVFETGGELRRAVQPRATAATCSSSRTSRSRRARADASWPTTSSSRSIPGRWPSTSGASSADPLVQAGQVDAHRPRPSRWPRSTGCRWAWAATRCRCPCSARKHGVPCDFYVKTLHSDDYPSATPKELRKEFIWLDGGKGWYDNMWCINPEETIAFMKTVTKPWIAFKVLAAGAILPRAGLPLRLQERRRFHRRRHVRLPDQGRCELAERAIRHHQKRQRPWRA